MGESQSTARPQSFDYAFVSTFSGPIDQKYKILRQLGAGVEGAAYLVELKAKGGRKSKARKTTIAAALRSSTRGHSNAPEEPRQLFVAKKTHNVSPAGRAEFLEEFEKMRQLDHPHCVKVIELVEGKDEVYVISEFAAGGDLFKYTQRMAESKAKISEQWIAQVFCQAMKGVAFLHDMGIVHNDLKPDNILVMEEFDPADPEHVPQVKVADFGCATLSRDTSFSWGDPRYQSPETWKRMVMVMEKKHSPQDLYKMSDKADVWSLGVTLFELLSGGKIPFLYRHAALNDVVDHKDMWNKLRTGIESEEIEIREHCAPEMSDEAVELLERMFQKDPAKRPSVAELLDDKWFNMKTSNWLDAESFSILDLNELKGKAHFILRNALVNKMRTDHDRRCWEIFQTVDRDHKGSINCKEFAEAMFEMKKLDAASSEKIFHAADVDGDQKLILREFMALTFDWKGVTKEVKDHGLRSLFRQIDANGSGSVSEKELTNALHGAVDPMAVRDVFTAMDTDRSGKVSEDEFEKFLFEPCSDELQSKYSERKKAQRQIGSECGGCQAWLRDAEALAREWLKERETRRLRLRQSLPPQQHPGRYA